MNSVGNPGSDDLRVARQASRASIAFGAVLTVLGIFAVLAPMFTGVAVTVLIGLLLLAVGFVEIVITLRAESFGKGVLSFLVGAITVLAAIVIIATPVQSLGVLTIVLAVFFVAGGAVDILLGLKLRPQEGWAWVLVSGIVSIVLGGLVIWQWPVSGVWAVGVFVGIRMLMHGWMLMALGRTGEESLTNLQDSRIEALERHVRAGARALQETQTVLADQAAMLLALSSELQTKVSAAEVDPAINDLNDSLGNARKWMHRAAEATAEGWNAAQDEANAAFEKLQHSSAELTAKLKQELGLGAPEDGADS